MTENEKYVQRLQTVLAETLAQRACWGKVRRTSILKCLCSVACVFAIPALLWGIVTLYDASSIWHVLASVIIGVAIVVSGRSAKDAVDEALKAQMCCDIWDDHYLDVRKVIRNKEQDLFVSSQEAEEDLFEVEFGCHYWHRKHPVGIPSRLEAEREKAWRSAPVTALGPIHWGAAWSW